jgi:hypothetical protein
MLRFILDGQVQVQVSRDAVVKRSETMHHMLMDCDVDTVTLTSSTWTTEYALRTWAHWIETNALPIGMTPIQRDQVISFANYMDSSELLQQCCLEEIRMIRGRTKAEIRAMFNIPDSFDTTT